MSILDRKEMRFSVIIPAYNEETFIGECLDSLLCQEFSQPFEIIVVDNNSTDATAEVAKSRGVMTVREERQGVCWARQRGTEMASGEIIVSTDADTTFSKDWLSRIDEEFRRDAGTVAVAGPFQFVDAPWWGRVWTGILFRWVRCVRFATGRVPYVGAANVAFTKSTWTGYRTYATQGGDELALLRNLQSCGSVAFLHGNPVFTSSRRLHRGLVYNMVVTLFYYYILGYTLNRLTSRSLVGMAPAFRSGAPGRPSRSRLWVASAGTFVCAVLLAGLGEFAGLGEHIIRFVGK